MGLIEWVRQPFDRIESNIRVLLKGDEDDLPEEDPIGEFLSLKATGHIQFENENCPDEIEDNAVLQELASGSGDAGESESSVVNLLQDPDEREPAKEELAVIAARDEDELLRGIEYEGESVDMVDDGNTQALGIVDDAIGLQESTAPDIQHRDGESLGTDGAIETGGDPQTAEAASEKNSGNDQSQTEKPLKDEAADSLLDVFREEHPVDNPISILSRGLDDTCVYSLLEETKRIADSFKKSSRDNR